MSRVTVLERTTQPLLCCDRPHEDFCLGWFNVIRDGGRWRMWYTACDHTYRDDRDGILCYAESPDGLNWDKPAIGFVTYDKDRNNNILAIGREVGGLNAPMVFVDHAAPAEQRYRMVYTTMRDWKWIVHGAVSADGLAWRFLPEPLLHFNSDTQAVCIPDNGVYRLYVRMWSGAKDYEGLRMVGYCQSDRFRGFGDPVEILRPDGGDPPDTDFYNNAATRLGPRFFIILTSAFDHTTQSVRPLAALSRDGVHFERVGRSPVLELGSDFDSMGIYFVPGAFPGPRPNTWWFYYVGTSVGHDDNVPTKARAVGGVGRALLEIIP